MIFTPHQILFKSRMRWAGHVARMREVYTGFWWENIRERDHLEGTGVDGRIILRWIFRKCVGEAWTGLIWLRIGTGGGHLYAVLNLRVP